QLFLVERVGKRDHGAARLELPGLLRRSAQRNHVVATLDQKWHEISTNHSSAASDKNSHCNYSACQKAVSIRSLSSHGSREVSATVDIALLMKAQRRGRR